jgi:hypothetical protein
MPYMLLIVEDPAQRGSRTRAEGEAVYQRMLDFGSELKDRGQLLASQSLTSLDQASRVQVRGGKTHVVDGPFAEAKEMIGGFFMVDVATRAEALEIAARCPAGEWSTVEVRSLGPCFA